MSLISNLTVKETRYFSIANLQITSRELNLSPYTFGSFAMYTRP
jgi:hypothetical protein